MCRGEDVKMYSADVFYEEPLADALGNKKVPRDSLRLQGFTLRLMLARAKSVSEVPLYTH